MGREGGGVVGEREEGSTTTAWPSTRLFNAPIPPPAPHPTPKQPVPAVLEIPSKDSPYDPNQDSLLLRVKHLLGMS